MGRIARKTFTANGSFTVPAGVTRVKVISSPVGQGGGEGQLGAGSTALFVDNEKNVWAMGYGNTGILGNGTTTSVSSPVQASSSVKLCKLYRFNPGGQNKFTSAFAQGVDGNLYAWGGNTNGQLGIGSVSQQSSPVQVSLPAGVRVKKLTTFDMGNVGVFGLDTTGKLWAWGTNQSSVLGTGVAQGSTGAYSTPTAVVGSHVFTKVFYTNPALIANNSNGAFAIDSGFQLWGWGSNTSGMGGAGVDPGVLSEFSSPTLVVSGPASWSTVFTVPTWGASSQSNSMVFGLGTDGTLWAWGSNANGQLGIGLSPGVTAAVSSPVQVAGSHVFTAMATVLNQISSNYGDLSTNAAIDSAGAAWTWGLNGAGQLGNNAATAAVSSPVQVVGGHVFQSLYTLGNIVTSSVQCMWGIDTSGQLWGWGDNSQGLLGINSLVSKSSPVMVVFPGSFGKITSLLSVNCDDSAGGFPCLLAQDDKGNAYTWGYNNGGQQGTGLAPVGTASQTSSPVVVAGSHTFQQIFADTKVGSLYGVDLGGTLYAWGINSNGQLGVGDTNPRSTPTVVLGTKNVLTAQTQTETVLDVVPGTSYSITFNDFLVMFGLTCVGNLADVVTIEFEQ